MIRIKVQYDAYNRTFKLVDRELAAFLEDHVLYDLAVPFVLDDSDEGSNFTADANVAHA